MIPMGLEGHGWSSGPSRNSAGVFLAFSLRGWTWPSMGKVVQSGLVRKKGIRKKIKIWATQSNILSDRLLRTQRTEPHCRVYGVVN